MDSKLDVFGWTAVGCSVFFTLVSWLPKYSALEKAFVADDTLVTLLIVIQLIVFLDAQRKRRG